MAGADERVWMVRSTDGREASEPVSLAKIRRGLHLGKLSMDMEVARVGTDAWEPILALIARHEPVPRADESAPFSALSGEVSPPAVPPAPPPSARVVTNAPAAFASSQSTAAREPSKADKGTSDMPLIDRIEKGARAALWLTLALMFLGTPLAYVSQHRTEAALREQLANAEAQFAADLAKERAPKPTAVLPFASFGTALSLLSLTKAEGHTWFTNVSPRAGVVCLEGIAKNPTTQRSTTSLPSCAPVAPYASDVHVSFMFAGRDLEEICPKASCDFSVKDAPEPKR